MTTATADRTHVVIALDFPEPNEAERFLSLWRDREKPFVKVGMQLFYAAGPRWVASLVETGYSVFLDLKLHDIPHTVAGGIGSLTGLGVDWITLHAGGGKAMMEAAKAAASAAGSRRPRLLAVTQLTSMDRRAMNDELGIPGTVRDAVLRYARLAEQAGMDGVVCSGEEAGWIKEKVGRSLMTVTPGIRLNGQRTGDQKRVMTPEKAVRSGADHLVVGRPITRAQHPVEVYEEMVKCVQQTRRENDV
ncbi:orotidine-5'-phosphate decarboxylase [Paludifilum halophilum]|uniref:Orotidine 5'-phosphate decarboxylase n=1 Tax=Paludifilum halophilum TaxID=1642702 RepID=A0A235B4V4_9BACL|nr:orotidine-5'-phosphate decarboxylase [Paludifilum halophilum]OYD06645.1 orotidine-5'-phosphate decarboxylase [Paludifilum halophilum]